MDRFEKMARYFNSIKHDPPIPAAVSPSVKQNKASSGLVAPTFHNQNVHVEEVVGKTVFNLFPNKWKKIIGSVSCFIEPFQGTTPPNEIPINLTPRSFSLVLKNKRRQQYEEQLAQRKSSLAVGTFTPKKPQPLRFGDAVPRPLFQRKDHVKCKFEKTVFYFLKRFFHRIFLQLSLRWKNFAKVWTIP